MNYEVMELTSLKDVSELIRIHNEVWDNSTGIIDLLENSTECLILKNTQLHKVVAYLFLERDKEGGFIEINDIAVDPDHRKKGYGKILMNHALGRYNYLKLNVDATNQKVIDFYRHLGFETEATIENYYSINKDALRLFWRKKKITSGS
jgi:ribosomal protein S18 acetylase RimI-like enzyme